MEVSDKLNETRTEKRRLVYLEDAQGYYTTPFLFETDCDWPTSKLEELSWEPVPAGRFSTSFDTFKDLLIRQGYECKLIQKYGAEEEPPESVELVKGATGNY